MTAMWEKLNGPDVAIPDSELWEEAWGFSEDELRLHAGGMAWRRHMLLGEDDR